MSAFSRLNVPTWDSPLRKVPFQGVESFQNDEKSALGDEPLDLACLEKKSGAASRRMRSSYEH